MTRTYREAAATILNAKIGGIGITKLEIAETDIDEYEVRNVLGPFLWIRIGEGYWELMTKTDSDGRPRATMGDMIGNYLGDLRSAVYNLCKVATKVLVQCRGVHWNDPKEGR